MVFTQHLLMGVFDLINFHEMVMGQIGHGPKWIICSNDPQSGDFGAGFLIYKGNMIQMRVISGTMTIAIDKIYSL